MGDGSKIPFHIKTTCCQHHHHQPQQLEGMQELKPPRRVKQENKKHKEKKGENKEITKKRHGQHP